MPPSLGPLASYHLALADGFAPDPAQERAAQVLQRCFQALHAPGAEPPRGVYLHGPVGRGKTWLMDRFFAGLRVPARREHFHTFMRHVHRRLFALCGRENPLEVLAAELAGEIRVLCFDELFVGDIGDAMILGGLFQALIAAGVVLVATSNQRPGELYGDGFNRERFLPAVAALESHMHVVAVDGEADHRLHPGRAEARYWHGIEGGEDALAAAFHRLRGTEAVSLAPLRLGHRDIPVLGRTSRLAWLRHAELCAAPLSAQDFLALCDQFSALFLSGVPALGGRTREGRIARGTEDGVEQVRAGERVLPALARHDDEARRFIALVDECYDRRIPLYLAAEVPLDGLYTGGYLEFPFRRTLSRLKEMQLARFGAA